jgi:CubicO group peptidase (beta-lactamase class C family)
MLRRASSIVALLAFTACVGGASPKPAPAPTPKAAAVPKTVRTLAADETVTLASGTTFQLAKGWTIETTPDFVTLVSPEKDARLVLFETTEIDGDKAISEAFLKARPELATKIHLRTTPPARNGWEAVTQIAYEVPAAESRDLVALARRFGGKSHVTILDGTNAGMDRRGAQIALVLQSYKPKGLAEESFAGKKANVLDAARLAAFTTWADDARKTANVPGMAIGIVQDGKVVFTKGFGVKKLGLSDPVTPGTMFMIASMTKTLTTIMMARLVDDKKFTWTTPVTAVEPAFALGDAEATKKLEMRHLVCACTGMPRQDAELFFEYGSATPESRIASLKTMKPTTAFGETFQYSNLLVAAGGYLSARAADPKKTYAAAYAAQLSSKVLVPLGMKSTTVDAAVVEKGDHATPHAYDADWKLQPTSLRGDEDPVAAVMPSGGAWSTVEDIARVILLELGKGTLDGKRVVSEENLLYRRKPMAKIDDKRTYGLGLANEDYHGALVVGHGGNLMGFTSDYFWLPEHDVGMVVLMNQGGGNALRSALMRHLVEVLFDGRDEARENLAFGVTRRRDAHAKEMERVVRTPDAAWVEALAGTWSSPGLGTLVIKRDGDRATLDAGEWTTTFGKKTDVDGSTSIYFLDAPYSGFELLLQQKEKEGPKTLLLDMNQQKYVFSRAK